MCKRLRTLLQAGQLHIHENMVAADPKAAVDNLKKELFGYSVLQEPSKSPFATYGPKRTFTGKLQGQQDDMAMALQIAVLSQTLFYESDKYRQYRGHEITWKGKRF